MSEDSVPKIDIPSLDDIIEHLDGVVERVWEATTDPIAALNSSIEEYTPKGQKIWDHINDPTGEKRQAEKDKDAKQKQDARNAAADRERIKQDAIDLEFQETLQGARAGLSARRQATAVKGNLRSRRATTGGGSQALSEEDLLGL
jgi:hypothetical protein